jgi:hypothetical protein
MASTRASGTAVLTGQCGNVLGLRSSPPTGTSYRWTRPQVRGRLRLTRHVGSEGTGVITNQAAAWRPGDHAGVCQFATLEAGQAAQSASRPGTVARIELLDDVQRRGIRYSKAEDCRKHCSGSAARRACGQVADAEITAGSAARSMGEQGRNRSRLWKARHSRRYAVKAMNPGKVVFAPIPCRSRWPDCSRPNRRRPTGLNRADRRPRGRRQSTLSVAFDPEAPGEREKVNLAKRISLRAIAMGGFTGEHGSACHSRRSSPARRCRRSDEDDQA